MHRLLTPLILVAMAASPAGTALALPTHGDSVPPVRAARLASPVVIDGLLNDAAWQGAPAVTRLTQSDPDEGAAPAESTWAWIAYDDDAVYVAARCWDSHPDSIVARLVRRDTDAETDWFEIWLDPYHDHRSGYYFTVSAAGVLYDGVGYNDGMWSGSWDGVWQARSRRDHQGYACEMRIPLSQLRFKTGAEQVWGVNFHRYLSRRRENDFLVYTPRGASGSISRLPHLVGIRTRARSRAIELSPYVTGKGEYLAHGAGDPFNDGSRHTPGLGADLRAGVGNNLTLNATANPDFGQVEVDPAVVNLSDVESFFEEKRPFFTENVRIFGFGNEGANDYWNFDWPEPVFFYSRRIGRAPQGSVPEGATFSDVPVAAHILGAAKLTGKLVDGLNVGTMHAVTSRENAEYEMGGARGGTEVEPLTYYGVARGLREFRGGSNGLGTMATLAQRRLGSNGLEDALNRQSLLAGLDGWHFLDRRKVWVLSGWAGMSRVAGTEPRMIALQRNSIHYLQRPDAENLGVDSSATSLTGYGARLWLHKQQGSVLFNAAVGFMDPKFDVNDMGYQSRANVVNAHLGGGYNWLKPSSWRKRGRLAGSLFQVRDFDGNLTGGGLYSEFNLQFRSDYILDGYVRVNPGTMSDRRTRGGPLTTRKPNVQGHLHMDSDSKRKITTCTNVFWGASPDGANRYAYLRLVLGSRPVPNVYFQVGPQYEQVIEDAQYVRQVSAAGFVPENFGDLRYVFARLDQRTVSAGIRLNVSFTPDLSLETYVQPLVSVGRYADFKELARAGSYDFLHYGRDNGSTYDAATGEADPDGPGGPAPAFVLPDPNFNFKSLRGNAVLRWQYRPGSVLYLVWTQARTDFENVGDLDFGASARRLLDARADNIFLVKATYYLNL